MKLILLLSIILFLKEKIFIKIKILFSFESTLIHIIWL